MTQSPLAKERQAWNKTDGKCWYCGVQLVWKELFSIDHVIPMSRGGKTSEITNMVPACFNCNKLKDNFMLEEYRVLCALIEAGYPTPVTSRQIEWFIEKKKIGYKSIKFYGETKN